MAGPQKGQNAHEVPSPAGSWKLGNFHGSGEEGTFRVDLPPRAPDYPVY